MPKCIYKDKDNDKCYCSTSGRHLEVVTEKICRKCCSLQENPTIGDKQRFQNIIKEVIDLLNNNDVEYAKKILNKAMKI
jgi:uncharacterized protein YaaR (DUF327 family)